MRLALELRGCRPSVIAQQIEETTGEIANKHAPEKHREVLHDIHAIIKERNAEILQHFMKRRSSTSRFWPSMNTDRDQPPSDVDGALAGPSEGKIKVK